MADQRPVAVWCVPRSLSTAFERIFVERGDMEVFHEPFSASYYYSTERCSDRYADEEPKEEYAYERVLAGILSPKEKPAFVKDMAYHVACLTNPEFVRGFRNTFLIREPRYVLDSLSKMWPDFTFEEAGYEEQHRLFGYTVEEGQEPVVVDAQDLSEDPEGIVRAYCEAVGAPFVPEALSWKPREVPEWQMWEGWHDDAQQSTGIEKLPHEGVTLSDELEEVYGRCLPFYEELYKRRLKPRSPADV